MRDSFGTLDYAAGIPAAAVAALDPLNADEIGARLPAMNRRGEVSELAAALRQIMPSGIQASEFTSMQCLAAMRDIGMLLSSIKRHGVQPMATVPEIEEILLALGRRSPAFFARGLRPYFEDITVAGRSYLGPAAANMPIALIDLARWASDHPDDSYTAFHRDTIEYSPPQWRKLYRLWHQRPSLAHTITTRLAADPDTIEPTVCASGRALCRVLRVLTVFRGKHLTIARRAYREEVRPYPVGSGGGSVELLTRILYLTRTIATHVDHSNPHACTPPDSAAPTTPRRAS